MRNFALFANRFVLLYLATSFYMIRPADALQVAKTPKTTQNNHVIGNSSKSSATIPVDSKPITKSVVLKPTTNPTTSISSTTLPPITISTGQKTELLHFLMPEHPTIFAFFRPSSSIERDFIKSLSRDTQSKIGFCVIELQTGKEPITEQYQIKETPTALVYDRRGRLQGRSSNADEIRNLTIQALNVMRIDWAKEGDSRLDAVRQMMGNPKNIPAILRTMSLRPDYLQGFMNMSMPAQFSDGFIDRRTKEIIGTYASALNKCKYCLGSHALNLQLQGENAATVDAIALLEIDAAKLNPKERAMLDYVKLLTLEPSKVRDTNTEALRKAGWTDDQIFEISFITSLFAFTNRMADAYGLNYPSKGWLPPTDRLTNNQSPPVQKPIP